MEKNPVKELPDLSNKVKYSCTIDNTGKYKTTIPYGNYYFIFKYRK